MRPPVPSFVSTSIAALAVAGLLVVKGSIAQQSAEAEKTFDRAIEGTIRAQAQASESQKLVETLDDDSRQLLQQYRAITVGLDEEVQFNAQLSARTTRQAGKIAAIYQQLRNVSRTEREISPLLERMYVALTQFIDLDMPFLAEERALRQRELRLLLDRSEAPLAEKFRRLLSAYQVEVDYGRTLEAYQARLPIADPPVMVHVLRFGRVGLYYLTLDELHSGHWDKNQRKFVSLADSNISAIRDGLAIARHQSPPELVPLPVVRDFPETGTKGQSK